MSAVFDNVEFRMGNCLYNGLAVFKRHGLVLPAPKQQGWLFQIPNADIGFVKRFKHPISYGGKDGAFETLVLHLNLVLILKMLDSFLVEHVGCNSLDQTHAAEQTESQLAKDGDFQRFEN